MIKAVFLDTDTMRPAELDWSRLQRSVTELVQFAHTDSTEAVARIADATVVITNKVRITDEIMANAPKLKLICVAATGTNNIELNAARERGIVVCNAQGYSTESVAQHTMAFMLNMATHFCAYTQDVSKARWSESSMFCRLDYPIVELSGKTLGIIGYGHIGKRVAHIAQAFGMKIMIAQIPGRPAAPGRMSLSDLLKKSDVLSLHCPLTADTRNLIAANELDQMKASAWLINMARGGIVNEWDLLEALRSGQIAAAATDVLEQEPPNENHPLISANLKNLWVTPHNAWASQQARQTLLNQIAENIEAFQLSSPKRVVN